MHVAAAEIGQPGCGLFGELPDALDAVDLPGDLGEDRGCVARAGPDLKDRLAALQGQGLGHQGDDVGLRDRLAFLDRERDILIGELAKLFGKEGLARDGAHGIQDKLGANAAPPNGLFNHLVAKADEVPLETSIHRIDRCWALGQGA